MKRVASILLYGILIIVLVACSSQPTLPAETPTTTTTVTTTTTTTTVTTTAPTYINEPYVLSDLLIRKIAETAYTSLHYDYTGGSVVPYEEVFDYYAAEACYTFDKRMISPDVLPYYNEKTMIFSVPHQLVDDYLVKRFNTVPDPSRIACYNQETGRYEIPRHSVDFHYDIDVVERYSFGDNKHIFTVAYRHGSGGETTYSCFSVQLTYDGYKILFHIGGKTTAPTMGGV